MKSVSTLFLFVSLLSCFVLSAHQVLAADDQSPHRCGFAEESTNALIARIRAGISGGTQRPDLPEFIEDADTTFRIHYTRTGNDAVPPEDANANGTPDFVEEAMSALLLSYRTYTDTMNYKPLPTDMMEGGSNALDIYLRDLSKAGDGFGLYGQTSPESMLTSVSPQRFTTWIQVDNNFSAEDKNVFDQRVFSTFGVDGLKVTCAHELHHAIQIGAYGIADSQRMVYEMCSVWMEIRIYPSILDWQVYTTRLLQEPYKWVFSDATSTNGYMWGWFGNTWRELRGDQVMRFVWEHIASGERPFQAVLNATNQAGFDFSNEFCAYAKELYYTGSRSRSGETQNSIIPEAQKLPEITLDRDEKVVAPSAVAGGEMRPYEVRVIRYTIPSIIETDPPVSAAFVLSWPEPNALVASDINARKTYTVTLSTTNTDGMTPINGTLWYFDVQPADICYSMEGASTTRSITPYPQPVHIDDSRVVFVPVSGAVPGDEASITLMNAQTVGLAFSKSTVVLDDTRIVAPFELPTNLAPATYLLHVKVNTVEQLLKVVVVR